MNDRQLVWSNKAVQKLAGQFVMSADACDRMQRKTCQDEDAILFRKFAGKRTSTKRNRGGTQGHYAVTPSGELLASSSNTDPKALAALMQEALKKWKTIPREKRLLAQAPDLKAAKSLRRVENLYPAVGIALQVISRDQKRVRWPDWNIDYAWFRKSEARAFLPAKHEVPAELVQRLARFHLIDNVYALNYTVFPKEAVEKAQITTTVTQIDGDLVSVSFEGESRASLVKPKKIGFEPKLLGRAKYNLKEEKFVSFELVAVGMRWGLGNCNQRHDATPARMGIVFTLAGDSPAERLPPAFITPYGW